MKTQTIKALQDLCDRLMEQAAMLRPQISQIMAVDICNAADRLKRVLDEEPKEKEHNVSED